MSNVNINFIYSDYYPVGGNTGFEAGYHFQYDLEELSLNDKTEGELVEKFSQVLEDINFDLFTMPESSVYCKSGFTMIFLHYKVGDEKRTYSVVSRFVKHFGAKLEFQRILEQIKFDQKIEFEQKLELPSSKNIKLLYMRVVRCPLNLEFNNDQVISKLKKNVQTTSSCL